MEKIGLNYDFEHLTPEMFRAFLRELQTNPYRWPNLYFAWEKTDGSLLMVGTNSSQMYHMLVRECDPEDWLNKAHAEYGEPLEYGSRLYVIMPSSICTYSRNGVSYDPVEKLVEKISACKYVGHWMDPDVLMDDPHGYNRVLACGRWDLAKEKIGIQEEPLVLEYHGDVDLPFEFIESLGDKNLRLVEAGKNLIAAQLEKISGICDTCVEKSSEYRNGYWYSFSFVVKGDTKVIDRELSILFGGLKYEAYHEVARAALEDKLEDAQSRSADAHNAGDVKDLFNGVELT